MRTNSIISDPVPVTEIETPKVPEVTKSDWEQIANSGQYPEFNQYLESRKEYYRRFLPDGRPVETVSPEERVAGWDKACCVIKEIEGIQANLLIYKK